MLLLLAACWSSAPVVRVLPPAELSADRVALRAAEKERLAESMAAHRERHEMGPFMTLLLTNAELVSAEQEAFALAKLEEMPPNEALAWLDAWRSLPERDPRVDEIWRRHVVVSRLQSPDRWVGVQRDHGRAVWAGVESEYVSLPESKELMKEVKRWFDVGAFVTEYEGLASVESVEQAVDAAVDAGWPEPVAVGLTLEAAMAGLDPWSRPIWPAQIANWEAEAAGVRMGVGLSVLDYGEEVIIDRPLPGSPAMNAQRVHQGDAVVGLIDGDLQLRVETLEPPRAEKVAALLLGPDGSKLTLQLARDGQSWTTELTRAAVPLETAFGWEREANNAWNVMVGDDVAYVRIAKFRQSTPEELDALLAAASESTSALILDLRGNPGGDLTAATEVIDRFVADGAVVTMHGRNQLPPPAEGEVAWNHAVPGHGWENTAVVVLVDRESASAAEIVAGALQQRVGAVVIGEETVGKGASQGLRSDAALGVAWQLTTHHWALPDGHVLSLGHGVQPNREMTLTAAEKFQIRTMAAQREALTAHQDGTPLRWLGTTRSAELPLLASDPLIEEAKRVIAWAREQPGDHVD